MTTRRQYEEESAILTSTFEHSPDAIVLVNARGVIVRTNIRTSELFGYPPEALPGQTIETLMPERFHQYHLAARDKFFASPQARPMGTGPELFARRADGSEFLADIMIAPATPGARPEKMLYMAIIRDISERQRLESQLRQAQKMEAVGQLTGGLAHDFNNLLAVIIGNLDLLIEQLDHDTPAERLAQNALSASLRGAEVTRKLLAFSRKQPLAPMTVSLNTLVTGMADLLRSTLGEKIELFLHLAKDLWPVEADAAQVESALLNLAVNSRDAMPGGGCLTIETGNCHLDEEYAASRVEVAAGDYVMLAVSDSGTGIPKELISRVFEPFFTTKDVGKGSGLGLSMVYGFAKQSRGHLAVYSEIGHGTTIRLYLPRSRTVPEATVVAETPAAELAGSGQLILVVDDNAEVRKVVTAQMAEIGYRTLEAEDGVSALDMILANPQIDLLFTDIVMPGTLNGVALGEAARRLRPTLPILYTSGFTEESLTNGTAKAVANESLLSKPYRKQDLAKKLHDLFRSLASRSEPSGQ